MRYLISSWVTSKFSFFLKIFNFIFIDLLRSKIIFISFTNSPIFFSILIILSLIIFDKFSKLSRLEKSSAIELEYLFS